MAASGLLAFTNEKFINTKIFLCLYFNYNFFRLLYHLLQYDEEDNQVNLSIMCLVKDCEVCIAFFL